MLSWLKWFLLCPLRRRVLRDPKGLRLQHGGRYEGIPLEEIFRLYHPAFWVLFWSLMWTGRRLFFRGRWLKWLVWCGGGFVELLLTKRLPTMRSD